MLKILLIKLRLEHNIKIVTYRRTSPGLERCSPSSPPTRAKPLFFWQKLNFSGRIQQPKMKIIFLCIY